ncbi:MAG: hypothetical protein ACYCOU_08300 [Sulfobacillus sp.]
MATLEIAHRKAFVTEHRNFGTRSAQFRPVSSNSIALSDLILSVQALTSEFIEVRRGRARSGSSGGG